MSDSDDAPTVEELTVENARLRAALAPFAALGAPSMMDGWSDNSDSEQVKVGQCRAAWRALNSAPLPARPARPSPPPLRVINEAGQKPTDKRRAWRDTLCSPVFWQAFWHGMSGFPRLRR